MSKKNDEAIKIAEEIIKNIEANPYTVSNIRKFFRLVDMLKIENEIEWVQRELYDYKDLNDCPGYRRVKSDKNKRLSN